MRWSTLCLAATLCGCSLSLEDPEQDAKDKLAKVIPARMDLMIGRWVGDSTYNVEDTRAERLAGVVLEILNDTTFSQLDTSGSLFPLKKAEGVFYLGHDTLIVFPLSANPDTFLVRLRFLGNYLELIREADQRFAFFHKIKPRARALEDSLLGDSLWLLHTRRLDPGVSFPEAHVRDFSYVRFSRDSMFADVRRNGVVRIDSGILVKKDSLWTWKAAGGEKSFVADLIHDDTLRLWPLTGGRADSGFYKYRRSFKHHFNDIDMRGLIGYLRGDSLVLPFSAQDYHYGRYLDWILAEDHKASVATNIAGQAMWNAWTLDSGYLSLSSPQKSALRFRVDTAKGRVRLTPDSSALFPEGAAVAMTQVDGSRFAAQPLERFTQAGYIHLYAAGDTMAYYFSANNVKDRFEAADSSNRWAGFTLGKAQETFQSSQPDFLMAFEGRAPALGNFTCRSRPYEDLVIRQTVSSDPSMATGLFQGACEIQKADSAFADSSFTFEGAFRMKRKAVTVLRAPVWGLP